MLQRSGRFDIRNNTREEEALYVFHTGFLYKRALLFRFNAFENDLIANALCRFDNTGNQGISPFRIDHTNERAIHFQKRDRKIEKRCKGRAALTEIVERQMEARFPAKLGISVCDLFIIFQRIFRDLQIDL
jgi:hypothetical protein